MQLIDIRGSFIKAMEYKCYKSNIGKSPVFLFKFLGGGS